MEGKMPWIVIIPLLFILLFVGWLTKPIRQTQTWKQAMNILRIIVVLCIVGLVMGLCGGGN